MGEQYQRVAEAFARAAIASLPEGVRLTVFELANRGANLLKDRVLREENKGGLLSRFFLGSSRQKDRVVKCADEWAQTFVDLGMTSSATEGLDLVGVLADERLYSGLVFQKVYDSNGREAYQLHEPKWNGQGE